MGAHAQVSVLAEHIRVGFVSLGGGKLQKHKDVRVGVGLCFLLQQNCKRWSHGREQKNDRLNCVIVIVVVTAIGLISWELWSVLEPSSQGAQACRSVHAAYVYHS